MFKKLAQLKMRRELNVIEILFHGILYFTHTDLSDLTDLSSKEDSFPLLPSFLWDYNLSKGENNLWDL